MTNRLFSHPAIRRQFEPIKVLIAALCLLAVALEYDAQINRPVQPVQAVLKKSVPSHETIQSNRTVRDDFSRVDHPI